MDDERGVIIARRSVQDLPLVASRLAALQFKEVAASEGLHTDAFHDRPPLR